MDGFDTDPTNFASTSLACGAIAIDPADPDRVYVGTGEGDTDALFAARIVNALPAYRGIGPVRSDDGGVTWINETSKPSLAGFAFLPDRGRPGGPASHCVAATTNGLYERVPSGAVVHLAAEANGRPHERRRRARGGDHDVVRRRAGRSRLQLDNGCHLGGRRAPDSRPAIGRIALGVQRDNPNVLYAFIATPAGGLHSVRRLDGEAGAWQNIPGRPRRPARRPGRVRPLHIGRPERREPDLPRR